MTKVNSLMKNVYDSAMTVGEEAVCRLFSWLSFRNAALILASVVALCGSIAEASVPMTVKCRCERADADRDIGNKTETLWVFVLDHSGTMGTLDATSVKHGSSKVSRWTALKDSFEETVRSIPNGSRVQIYCVGGKKKRSGWGFEKIWDGMEAKRIYAEPLLIRNRADRDRLVRDVSDWGAPTWGTPLYDALYQACEDVQNFAPSGNSCVVVFSDGKDEYHSDRCKTLQDIRNSFAKGSSKSVGLFASDEFDACLTWIGNSTESPVPVFGEKYLWAKTHEIPFVCRVNPTSRLYNKRNPLETNGRAEISDLTYLFPMSSERWQAMLKHGTVKPTLELATSDGAVLGSCVMDLGKTANAVFQVPDSVFADNKATTLKLNLLLPAKDGSCRFSKTVPVHVMFDKVGKVSITAIRPVGDVYVISGTKVDFSAEATAGSTFTWNFGDGTSATNCSVSHVYTNINEDGYPYSLTVAHGKMSPDTRGGKIYVVDAGVAFSDLPKNATEGVECALTCKAWKDVSSVRWYIDGACYRGTEQKAGRDTISILRHTFDDAREYKIQARANIQRIGECSTEIATIKVAAKPYARIVAPETANMRFDAEEDVNFAVRVSGVTSGKWLFRDKSGQVVKELDALVSTDKPISAARQSFAEGGNYVVSFVGKTAAGADVQSDAMAFRVNPRIVRIEIANPTADEEIKTDVAYTLRAKNVRGVDGVLQWFLTDANGENEKSLGESEVSADGTSEKSVNFKSGEYGEGAFHIVARSSDGKASSKPLPVMLRTDASIAIVQPANGQATAFDGHLTFLAKIASEGGVLKSDSVRWVVQRVGGEPEPAGDKESCSYQFKRIPKASSVSYTVRAEATLPSGRIVQSDDERTVVAYCPKVRLAVKTRPSKQGSETSYGLNEKIDFKLVNMDGGEVGPLSDIEWNMGDGTILKGQEDHLDYDYTNYHTSGVEISASCKCALCGDPAKVKPYRLKVEKQPPKAVLEILEKGSRFGTGDVITLSAKQSYGDKVDYIWEIDGKERTEYRGKDEICIKLPKRPCEMVAKLRLIGPEGTEPSDAQREIRVRNGWIGVGIFALLVLVVVVLAVLLFNNGPAGWVVRMYCCERIDHSTKEGVDLEISKYRNPSGKDTSRVKRFTLAEYWSWSFLGKKAVIQLKKIMNDRKTPRAFKESVKGLFPDPNRIDDKIYVYPTGNELIKYEGVLKWDAKDGLPYHKLEDRRYRQYYREKDSRQPPRRFRFILDDSCTTNKYEVYFVILTFCAIVAASWAALKYAI